MPKNAIDHTWQSFVGSSELTPAEIIESAKTLLCHVQFSCFGGNSFRSAVAVGVGRFFVQSLVNADTLWEPNSLSGQLPPNLGLLTTFVKVFSERCPEAQIAMCETGAFHRILRIYPDLRIQEDELLMTSATEALSSVLESTDDAITNKILRRYASAACTEYGFAISNYEFGGSHFTSRLIHAEIQLRIRVARLMGCGGKDARTAMMAGVAPCFSILNHAGAPVSRAEAELLSVLARCCGSAFWLTAETQEDSTGWQRICELFAEMTASDLADVFSSIANFAAAKKAFHRQIESTCPQTLEFAHLLAQLLAQASAWLKPENIGAEATENAVRYIAEGLRLMESKLLKAKMEENEFERKSIEGSLKNLLLTVINLQSVTRGAKAALEASGCISLLVKLSSRNECGVFLKNYATCVLRLCYGSSGENDSLPPEIEFGANAAAEPHILISLLNSPVDYNEQIKIPNLATGS